MEDLEYAESVELAHQLQLEGARNVMVSMGNEGAFLLTESRGNGAPLCAPFTAGVSPH